MSGWWLSSYLALWALVLATFVVLLIVLRQLGLIYLRGQAGAQPFEEGPAIDSSIGRFHEIDLETGEGFFFPDPDASLNLLVFASPSCAICKDMLPGLPNLVRRYDVNVLVVSEGDVDDNRALRGLVDGVVPFVISLVRQRTLKVVSIPYGIVANGEGVVLEKGVVNDVSALEALLDRAAETRLKRESDEMMASGVR